MLRCLILVYFLLPFHLLAQVVMENGKVLSDNNIFATYEAVGEKKPNLINKGYAGTYESNPESIPGKFKDYFFSTPDGEQFVFATAKVVASPYNSFVKYYYSIQFGDEEEALNVQYHPLTMDCLARDMVKYKVLKNGRADEEAWQRLAANWKKNKTLIDDRILSLGSIRYYNNSPYHLEDNDRYLVTLHGHNIYYKDSLLATYELSQNMASTLPGTSKEDYYYYLNYPDGKPYAEVQFQIYSSKLFVWPAPLKDPFNIYTAERDEAGIIKAACTFLLNRQAELAANNK
ncbi:MAG: hypothetical protein JST70_00065 [Bacteroidetes bacterium]|nr:hypothetical protein [Bacteroidota bacterium]